jgi:hypothetical protein
MGINTSSCLDEALCGKEDIPDHQTCENIKPGANFLSIEVQEEPSQIHPPPPLKLENPQNLSGSDDDDDDQNSDQESNESVMTVISPTKDIAPMRAFTRYQHTISIRSSLPYACIDLFFKALLQN